MYNSKSPQPQQDDAVSHPGVAAVRQLYPLLEHERHARPRVLRAPLHLDGVLQPVLRLWFAAQMWLHGCMRVSRCVCMCMCLIEGLHSCLATERPHWSRAKITPRSNIQAKAARAKQETRPSRTWQSPHISTTSPQATRYCQRAEWSAASLKTNWRVAPRLTTAVLGVQASYCSAVGFGFSCGLVSAP
jgi:hypothetical protein